MGRAGGVRAHAVATRSGERTITAMETIHISEAEAARDLSALLERVRSGAEVVIEAEVAPSVVLRAVTARPTRRLAESLRLAREYGSPATLDGGFAADLGTVIDSHREPLNTLWD